MPQDLYPDDRWKDIPEDFRSFEHQPDGGPNTSYFFSHFLSRVGYSAGATLTDPALFARQLNIPDQQVPAIAAFLERHGFTAANADGSLMLTKRGEEWYGYITEYRQEMLWHIDEPTWRKDIESIHDARRFEEIVGALNEHHAPMMRQFAKLLAREAARDHSSEAVRLGVLAVAVAIGLANDGSRPQWIPSPNELRETLELLYNVAEQIGLDAGDEFARIADRLSGIANALIAGFAEGV